MKTRQQDLDFDLKQDEIDDRVRVLVAERGRPETAEAAIAMANEAYETVNSRVQAADCYQKANEDGIGVENLVEHLRQSQTACWKQYKTLWHKAAPPTLE